MSSDLDPRLATGSLLEYASKQMIRAAIDVIRPDSSGPPPGIRARQSRRANLLADQAVREDIPGSAFATFRNLIRVFQLSTP